MQLAVFRFTIIRLKQMTKVKDTFVNAASTVPYQYFSVHNILGACLHLFDYVPADNNLRLQDKSSHLCLQSTMHISS